MPTHAGMTRGRRNWQCMDEMDIYTCWGERNTTASLLPGLLPLMLRLALDNAQGVILWYA